MDNEKFNDIDTSQLSVGDYEIPVQNGGGAAEEPAAKEPGSVAEAQAALAEVKKEGRGKIIIAIIIIAFLALVGWRVYDHFFAKGEVEDSAMISVKTAVAQQADIHTDSPITATVQAGEQVYVVPAMAGKVATVNARNGDHVTKGQTLLTIDSSTVSGQVQQAKMAVDLAKQTLDRMQVLYDAGAISLADYQGAKAQYDNAVITYNTAASSIEYYTVTAPISGILSSFSVTAGTLVGQSMIGAISDTSNLTINPKVTEKMALKMTVGEKVEIYVASLERSYTGTVKSIASVPDAGGVTYPVEISIANEDSSLKAGMFAEVRVQTEKSQAAVVVPSQTVFTKNGESVAVVLNGTIPKIVKVETGIDNGEQVEILSGIKAGDTVVISGQQYVKDGEEVKVY